MIIVTEIYGEQIGVDNNLRRLIEKKQCRILLTLQNDEQTTRHQFVLSKDDAMELIEQLQLRLSDPVVAENGFEIV